MYMSVPAFPPRSVPDCRIFIDANTLSPSASTQRQVTFTLDRAAAATSGKILCLPEQDACTAKGSGTRIMLLQAADILHGDAT